MPELDIIMTEVHDKKPLLSAKVMQLKFMQRAQAKDRRAEDSAAAERKEAEVELYWTPTRLSLVPTLIRKVQLCQTRLVTHKPLFRFLPRKTTKKISY